MSRYSWLIYVVCVVVYLSPYAAGFNTCVARNQNGTNRYGCKKRTYCLTEIIVSGHCCGHKVCCDNIPCDEKNYDWIIMFDDSTSINETKLTKQKEFAKTLVNTLKVGPDDNWIGAMTFNDESRTNFFLTSNTDDIINGIMAIQSLGGWTDIAKALQFAKDPMLSETNGNRPTIPNVVIMILDGNDNGGGDIVAASQALVAMGTWDVVAIGVGNDIDYETLLKIASRPELIFQLDDFFSLTYKLLQKILGIICTFIMLGSG